MSDLTSIYHMIVQHARRNPDAIAIAAPGRVPLTYGRLLGQIDYTVRTLNAMGIGRNDRVAIVLPDGPEMAAALIAVASGATAAPLNPAYREEEFDFYLSDLKAKALIILSGIDSPAVATASNHEISIIKLTSDPLAEAGVFLLHWLEQEHAIQAGYAEPSDISMVVHTSGTTSRPKIIPMTQANICISASNFQAALNLTKDDRYLNVMPLFHLHGIRCLLSSLAAGSSVYCPLEFNASKFFEWMKAFKPTWYSAVPTMHQAILVQAVSGLEGIVTPSLRFVRSSSAPMSMQLMAELESTLKAPVIESYSLSEASQITTNPVPPGRRKAGSVGLPVGVDVSIMDELGNLLPTGVTGEIMIRGGSIIESYENNPAANASAFRNGWFRTGDQGYLDSDGYLFISGRLKEIINRGGEKISPREVDEVLMDHPAISQAVTFAVPHSRLGEDVAAAVVLRPSIAVTEKSIREFAAARLAQFKVPRQIIILNEIPKGPTGKLQRIGLAEKLGLNVINGTTNRSSEEYVAPRTPLEEFLAGIWAEVLEIEKVGTNDDFLELGGDSILAMKILSRVFEAIEVELSMSRFFESPTVANMAQDIEQAMFEKR